MCNNDKRLKKPVKVTFEQNDLEFFISQEFNKDHLKNIFSLTFPGYPTNFIFKNLDDLNSDFVSNSIQTINLLIPGFSAISDNFQENLIKSVSFENEPLKKIKLKKSGNRLTVKCGAKIFSNPYGLYSFDNYMELTFNNVKKKNDWNFSNEKKPAYFFLSQIYWYLAKYVVSNILNLANIFGQNSVEIIAILAFFEFLNFTEKISISELILKLSLKFCLINSFKNCLRYNIWPLNSEKKCSKSFMNSSLLSKELAVVNTLLFGIIRSGNMCSI